MVTPADIGREVGASASTVRRWLRANAERRGGPWLIDVVTAERARTYFAARARLPVVCQVFGCGRSTKGRGWCAMHYDRWYRTGTTEPSARGAHQATKTHCPAGHPYDKENTVIFSDGRRRCRTCRGRGTMNP